MSTTNEPAFPLPGTLWRDPEGRIRNPTDGFGYAVEPQPGMTLRDWFAGQALMLAAKAEHEFPCGTDHEPTYRGIAQRAYLMADAMLEARKQ